MLPFRRDVACPSCGHAHSFALPAGDWPAGTVCDYACPETGLKTAFTLGRESEPVPSYPQGTIMATPRPPAVPSPS